MLKIQVLKQTLPNPNPNPLKIQVLKQTLPNPNPNPEDPGPETNPPCP